MKQCTVAECQRDMAKWFIAPLVTGVWVWVASCSEHEKEIQDAARHGVNEETD